MSPKSKHRETHFTAGEVIRDIVIGMSDGLTVPFALAAGLSGAIANSGLVVTAGVAEVAAGSIAMGLGGYLAARGEAEHYDKERHREWCEVKEMPEEESREIFCLRLCQGALYRFEAISQCLPNRRGWHFGRSCRL